MPQLSELVYLAKGKLDWVSVEVSEEVDRLIPVRSSRMVLAGLLAL